MLYLIRPVFSGFQRPLRRCLHPLWYHRLHQPIPPTSQTALFYRHRRSFPLLQHPVSILMSFRPRTSPTTTIEHRYLAQTLTPESSHYRNDSSRSSSFGMKTDGPQEEQRDEGQDHK